MRTLLFHCPQMRTLAEKIVQNNQHVELRVIRWDEFPDTFPNLFIEEVEGVRGRDVAFLASFDTLADIVRQLGVIYALPRYGARSLKILLPYFTMGTMERVKREGEIATAMTLARMISAVPLCGGGPVELIIVDVHALQTRFYFSDHVVPQLISAIPLLVDRIRHIPNVAVAFPDKGARDRFEEYFAGFEIIRCDKVRHGTERCVTIVEGDPAGKYVVIVDDLGMSGGTQRACRDALIVAGARAVATSVTHGVYPNGSWTQFTPDLFDRVFITDSCPQTAQDVAQEQHIEVLSIAPLLAHALRS